MNLKLNRYSKSAISNIGYLSVDGVAICQTLENPSRHEKLDGITAIKAGVYEIKFRRVLSPKTEHYRSKYPWFTWHLELQGVPDFEYIYIHIGNTAKDTNGCILVGESAHIKNNTISSSTSAFIDLYLKIGDALGLDEKVFIEIVDL